MTAATLPEIRGPLSAAVVDTLAGGRRDDLAPIPSRRFARTTPGIA
ncbi:hypothetical protein [Amycolatopsis oliviviridis]|nr:hypothetical protein [Amycolatopsis oliviviridis]